MTLENDPWGKPFKIVTRRLRRGRAREAITDEMKVKIIEELFAAQEGERKRLPREVSHEREYGPWVSVREINQMVPKIKLK